MLKQGMRLEQGLGHSNVKDWVRKHLQMPWIYDLSSTPMAGHTHPLVVHPLGAAGSVEASALKEAHLRAPRPVPHRECHTAALPCMAVLGSRRYWSAPTPTWDSVAIPQALLTHRSQPAGHHKAPCSHHLGVADEAGHQRDLSTQCQLLTGER